MKAKKSVKKVSKLRKMVSKEKMIRSTIDCERLRIIILMEDLLDECQDTLKLEYFNTLRVFVAELEKRMCTNENKKMSM